LESPMWLPLSESFDIQMSNLREVNRVADCMHFQPFKGLAP
jgi:hypothetical protein